MKNKKKIWLAAGAAMMLALSGCGEEKAPSEELMPTAAPTATPTAAPASASPAPTATPAPRLIGTKDSKSKFVYLTNGMGTEIRELYLMVSGAGDWGRNLIPSESSVKAAEQVQMFYNPGNTSNPSAAEEGSDAATYDMKLITSEGDSYEIYGIEFSDMEKASLTLDQENYVAYLRYMSLSENKEKDTRDGSQQTGSYEENYDDSYEDDYYDDSYEDDGSYEGETSGDGSYEEDYGEGSSDDGYYEEDYEEGSSDDGSYDDGSYDDGSYDDGYYDDGYEDDYVEAGDGGSGDEYYETEEGY